MATTTKDDIEVRGKGIEPKTEHSLRLRCLHSEPPLHIEQAKNSYPVDIFLRAKCCWCKAKFEAPKVHPLLPAEALEQHIRRKHPNNHVPIPTHEQLAAREIYFKKRKEIEQRQLEQRELEQRELEQRELEQQELEQQELEQSQPMQANVPLPPSLPSPLNTMAKPESIEDRLATYWNIHDVRLFTKLDETNGDGEAEEDNIDRPKPYTIDQVEPGEFLPITFPGLFSHLLSNPDPLPDGELYERIENAQRAIQAWQQESLAIDKLIKKATRTMMDKTADPTQPEDPTIFEDKKEARLYNYKYDPKERKMGFQDPFIQGGFRPTKGQLRKMKAQAGNNLENVDNYPPIIKDGKKMIPRMRSAEKPGLKRSRSQLGEENGSAATPADTENERATPDGRRVMITRFRGTRRPATREPSESPSPDVSPTPKLRRVTRPSSLAASASPGPRRRQRAQQDPPTSDAASVPTPHQPSAVSALNPYGLDLDPGELAKRAAKIAKSDNPKRSLAMLKKWDQWRLEGKTSRPRGARRTEAAGGQPGGAGAEGTTAAEGTPIAAAAVIPEPTSAPTTALNGEQHSQTQHETANPPPIIPTIQVDDEDRGVLANGSTNANANTIVNATTTPSPPSRKRKASSANSTIEEVVTNNPGQQHSEVSGGAGGPSSGGRKRARRTGTGSDTTPVRPRASRRVSSQWNQSNGRNSNSNSNGNVKQEETSPASSSSGQTRRRTRSTRRNSTEGS